MILRPKLVGLTCLLVLNSAALGQKLPKKYPTSVIEQKNTDGTVSTITTDGHGFTEKDTRDRNNNVIDRITTKPDNTYGTGGTKVTVYSAKDKPQLEGGPVKISETIEEYKNKSGTVRHRELEDNISLTKHSIDYGEDGKATSYVETSQFGGKMRLRIKHDYDKTGRPLTTTVERRDDPGEPLEKYRISYKYNGDDDQQGTPTVEKYDEANEKWEGTKDIDPDYARHREAEISSEAARVIKSTERVFDLTGDLGPTPTVDIGGDSKEKKEPSDNKEASGTKTPSAPSTRQDIKPRRGPLPPKATTGPRTATRTSRSPSQQKRPPSAPPGATSADGPRIATGQAAIAGGIDPCLVGTWRSESVVYEGPEVTPLGKSHGGGSGIVMILGADGATSIDFDQMQMVAYEDQFRAQYRIKWKGTASGHIQTERNIYLEPGVVTVFVRDEKREMVDSTTLADEQRALFRDLRLSAIGTVTRANGETGPLGADFSEMTVSGNILPYGSARCGQTTLTVNLRELKVTFKREK